MKTAFAFAMMIGCTVIANLLLKVGASSSTPSRMLFGYLDWRVPAGLAFFGCAGIVYAWLLHWVPLNVAQSFAAAQYVAVIIVSAFVLSEEISPARWLGIALIALGIAVVGANTSTRAPRGDQTLPASNGVTEPS
jgi:drug/metabolite transporter (DMT)-like permease